MLINRFKLVMLFLLIGCFFAKVSAKDYPSWGNLEAGKYKVGFKTIRAYDSSRLYQPAAGIKFRPLLLHVWFPATKPEKPEYLPYRHYIALETLRETFKELSPAEIEAYVNQQMSGYMAYGKKLMGGLEVTLPEVLAGSTAALQNARPVKNKFPLLLYAPSFGKSAIQNNLVCEYLASHGYVVAAVASASENSQVMTNDEKGLMAQVKDLEFMVNFLKNQPNLNFSKIGTFGYSWGGFAAIMHQMRNDYVKAVASWDSSIEYQGYEIAKKMPDFKPEKVMVPYVAFNNKNEGWSEYPFFKSVPGNQKQFYRLKQFEHAHFVSYWNVFANTKEKASSYDTKSYETLCLLTRQFFDKNLKGKPEKKPAYENKMNDIIQLVNVQQANKN